MTDSVPQNEWKLPSTADRVFPTLRAEQIERAATHGHTRQVAQGEILVEAGEKKPHFFIVRSGQLEIVRPPGSDEHRVALLGPGQFTGETSMLSGRRVLARIRMLEAGEVIEPEREQLLGLIQTDSD